jgi:general secretion pathway protein L
MSVARITPNNTLIIGEGFNGHTVLVPSIHLSFFQLPLPAKTIAQCQKIIGFSLEEELAEDINTLHYTLQRVGQEWFVAVCSHEKMQQWLALCAENDITPKRLIPDILILPEESNFLVEPEQCLIRPTEGLPIAIRPQIIEKIHNLLPENVQEFSPFVAENYEELLESDLQVEKHHLNLLQNEYSKTASYTTLLKPWLKVALWGGLLWTSYAIYLFTENRNLDNAIQTNKQANIKKFKQLFPEETRIVNLRTQAEQKFSKIKQQKEITSISLIGLTEEIINALQDHKKVQVSQLNYRKYSLQLFLNSSSVASIQELINQLGKNKNLNIKVQSLGESNNKAKATLNIKKTT